MSKKFRILICFLWLIAALAAADEGCDRNAPADDWAEIAEGVDEMAADGLTQAELDEAESLSTPTCEPTRDVADSQGEEAPGPGGRNRVGLCVAWVYRES